MSIHHFPHTMCYSLLPHQYCTTCYEQRSVGTPRPNWPRSFSVCDVNVLRTRKVLFISSICNIPRIRFRCVPVPEYTFFLYVWACFITFGWTHSPANSTLQPRTQIFIRFEYHYCRHCSNAIGFANKTTHRLGTMYHNRNVPGTHKACNTHTAAPPKDTLLFSNR